MMKIYYNVSVWCRENKRDGFYEKVLSESADEAIEYCKTKYPTWQVNGFEIPWENVTYQDFLDILLTMSPEELATNVSILDENSEHTYDFPTFTKNSDGNPFIEITYIKNNNCS